MGFDPSQALRSAYPDRFQPNELRHVVINIVLSLSIHNRFLHRPVPEGQAPFLGCMLQGRTLSRGEVENDLFHHDLVQTLLCILESVIDHMILKQSISS